MRSFSRELLRASCLKRSQQLAATRLHAFPDPLQNQLLKLHCLTQWYPLRFKNGWIDHLKLALDRIIAAERRRACRRTDRTRQVFEFPENLHFDKEAAVVGRFDVHDGAM